MKRLFFSGTLLLFFLGNTVPATGALRQFIPKISSYSGSLAVNALHEENKKSSGEQSVSTTDSTFGENFTISSFGQIYHPRFAVFSTSVTAGIQERRFEVDGTAFPWFLTSTERYKVELKFLPKHRYNLDLHSSRNDQILTGHITDVERPIITQNGAKFRYRKKTWHSQLGYLTQEVQSRAKRETLQYNGATSFRKKYFNVSGAGNHHESKQNQGASLAEDALTLENVLHYEEVINLISHWGSTLTENIERTLKTENEQTNWSENITAKLPMNFGASARYSNHAGDTTNRTATKTTTTSRSSDTVGLNINHRLFDSLRSNFETSWQDSSTSVGKDNKQRWNAGLGYTKAIYGGNRLSGNANTGIITTDREGNQVIINETYEANPDLTLTNPYVVENSIVLMVIDPDPANPPDLPNITLIEDTHYTVTADGIYTVITIISLAGEPFANGYNTGQVDDYRYSAAYSQIPETAKFETMYANYGMRFGLFQQMLMPGYSHSQSETNTTSGHLTTEPAQTKTDSYSLSFSKAPIGGNTSYTRTCSTGQPSRALSLSGYYQKSFEDNWRMKFSLSHQITENLAEDTLEPTRKNSKAHLVLTKYLTQRNINFSFGSNVSYYEGRSEMTTYSLTSAVSWVIGRSHFSLSGNLLNSQNTNASTQTIETTTTTIMFNMTRPLF